MCATCLAHSRCAENFSFHPVTFLLLNDQILTKWPMFPVSPVLSIWNVCGLQLFDLVFHIKVVNHIKARFHF